MLKKLITATILVIIAFIPVLGCIAFFIQSMALDGPTIEQGKERADDIIVALEVHWQGYGKHPAELEQLVPDFLPEVPHLPGDMNITTRCVQKKLGMVFTFGWVEPMTIAASIAKRQHGPVMTRIGMICLAGSSDALCYLPLGQSR